MEENKIEVYEEDFAKTENQDQQPKSETEEEVSFEKLANYLDEGINVWTEDAKNIILKRENMIAENGESATTDGLGLISDMLLKYVGFNEVTKVLLQLLADNNALNFDSAYDTYRSIYEEVEDLKQTAVQDLELACTLLPFYQKLLNRMSKPFLKYLKVTIKMYQKYIKKGKVGKIMKDPQQKLNLFLSTQEKLNEIIA